MKNSLIFPLIAIAALLFNQCNSPTDNSVKIHPGYFPTTSVSNGIYSDQSYACLQTTRLQDGDLVIGVNCWTVDTLEYYGTGYNLKTAPEYVISRDSMVFQIKPWICGTGLTGSVSSKKLFTFQIEKEKELTLSKIIYTNYGSTRLEIDKITP